MTEPVVVRSATPEELADRVAAELVGTLRRVQSEGRVPAVVLTGGTIAVAIHEAVAGSPDAHLVDWSRVDVWFGDERYVPAGDPERNADQAAESLLHRLPFDPERIHAVPASDAGHASPDEAAAAYARELREHAPERFDVLMLGLGPDGHVASLFPGFPQLDVDDRPAVPVTGSPKPPPERVSLTFGTLNRSREVWFVVSGEGKADAVARALATGENAADVHEIPAVGVHGQERTVWYVDEAAASRL
jgi:6-phosphogluconolactonase